jgi:hypothetical protein
VFNIGNSEHAILEIQRTDAAQVFGSDEDAIKFVKILAYQHWDVEAIKALKDTGNEE